MFNWTCKVPRSRTFCIISLWRATSLFKVIFSSPACIPWPQVRGFDSLGGDMLVVQIQLLVMGDQFGPYFFEVAIKLFEGWSLGLGGSFVGIPVLFSDGLFQPSSHRVLFTTIRAKIV